MPYFANNPARSWDFIAEVATVIGWLEASLDKALCGVSQVLIGVEVGSVRIGHRTGESTEM